VSVGKLFAAALLPGFLLVLFYIMYVLGTAHFFPKTAPPMPRTEMEAFRKSGFIKRVLTAFVMPMLLIVAVLGSILMGIATPTEAAAVGAIGATVLTLIQKKLDWQTLRKVMHETTHLTTMVFLILLGATTFSFAFREMGGDVYLVDLIRTSELSPMVFLLLVMLVIFVAGFFIDFIEIIFIIVPVVTPIFIELNLDLIWIGILIGLNLQTSFLTPPFGFSLFYLKGVAPPEVTTAHLYRGILPFIVIQALFLLLIFFFPKVLYIVDSGVL
jgi:tripartite ATP-independent transporter DctM subunit